MKQLRCLIPFLALILVGGCATLPSGPSVMVLPGKGKSFEAFQQDKCICEQWALEQTGLDSHESQHDTIASGAAIGTLIGAGTGAILGAPSGNAGNGALIGAGGGLLAGTALATNQTQAVSFELQRRYDIAYQECMFAKGNQIPGVRKAPQKTYRLPPPPPKPVRPFPPSP